MNSSLPPFAAPQQLAPLAHHAQARPALPPAMALAQRGLVAALLLATAACTPEIGPCDPFAAREIVYLSTGVGADSENGTPMFAGQGLLQVSCGNGVLCHAGSDVTGTERRGVPLGLDFDFSIPCDPSGCIPGEIQRLRANQSAAFDLRHHILQSLEQRTMPPGAAGAEVRSQFGTFVRIDTSDPFFLGGVATGVPLPEPTTAEGRDIVRNWLACGLPMVDRFENPNTPQDSGRNCRGSTDCVYRVEPLSDPVVPHWESIYNEFIGPFCGTSCHSEGEPDFTEESQLDLVNIDLAFEQLVNRIATGEECIDLGDTLVIPGDAANSLLVDKMANATPRCGDPMPSGVRPPPEDLLNTIRQWINEGALRDCFDATFTAPARVAAPSNSVFNPELHFTLEAWIRPATVTSELPQRVIVAHQGRAEDEALSYVLGLNALGQVEASISTRGTSSVTHTHPRVLSEDEYHHVAMMVDLGQNARTFIIFVDGVPSLSSSEATGVHATTAPFTIGDYDPGVGSAPFTGVISDVRLSDTPRYALPPVGPALTDLLASGDSAFTPAERLTADGDTVVLYPMHAAPGATMAQDVSSNELHANITGTVTFDPVECRY